MGFCVDMKVGETVIAKLREDDSRTVHVKVEKKTGSGVRLVITAPPAVELVPPKKQPK